MAQPDTAQINEMRILTICDFLPQTERQELAETLTGCFELTDANSVTAVEILRRQVFDIAILQHTDGFDAFSLLPTLRVIGPENLAIVVAGVQPAGELEVRCLEYGADGYHCLDGQSSELLTWRIHRAIERRQLLAQAKQWSSHQAKTCREDQQAAIHQIRSLRAILLDDESQPQAPEWLVSKFIELMRVYVVAVSGDLTDDVSQLVVALKQSGVTLCEALMAHSIAVEQLVISIGARPGWHVIGRSQMLAYELLLQYSRDTAPVADLAAPNSSAA